MVSSPFRRARETLARGWSAIEDVLRTGARLPLLVSHGQLLALALHSIDGRFGHAGWESLRNPDVLRLRVARDGARRFERHRPQRLG